jgi:hypothetical protein
MNTTYRPRVRNGHISRRPVKSGHLGRAGWMPKSRRPQAIWALVILGALVAGGFITSLRWQLRTLDTSRRVVQLKSALDQAESERRYLSAAESGARNPVEIERAVNKHGAFHPLQLDDPSVIRAVHQMPPARKPAPNIKAQRTEKRTPSREVATVGASAAPPVSVVPASIQQ